MDKQLAPIAAAVKAGHFVEHHWEAFRSAYFGGMSDVDVADVLREWCDRHGIAPRLRQGTTELGGKVFPVIHLLLTVR